jgi:hypothetical protein
MLARHVISSGHSCWCETCLRELHGELDFETRTLLWPILGGSCLIVWFSNPLERCWAAAGDWWVTLRISRAQTLDWFYRA